MKNKEKNKELNLKNKEVKIYNKLANAKYAMNSSEQKLFLYAIRNIDQDADEFPVSEIKLTDFAKYADLDEIRLYKDIDKITTRLMQVIIHVEDNISKDGWSKYNLTKNCKYKSGVITFGFYHEMKPFLLGLQKNYFKQAPDIMGFSSWYSFRLYDILKSQAYKKNEIEVNIEWLKSILGIEDKYDDFTSLRRRVIDPARNEINEHSDITIIDYSKALNGRKVESVIFKIQVIEKGKKYSDLLVGMYDTDEFKKKIGLTPKVLTDMQIIELYDLTVTVFTDYRDMEDLYEYMRLNYSYTKEMKPYGNPYYYYKKALENDYAKAIPQILTGYFV